jgi:hypothetical protein
VRQQLKPPTGSCKSKMMEKPILHQINAVSYIIF